MQASGTRDGSVFAATRVSSAMPIMAASRTHAPMSPPVDGVVVQAGEKAFVQRHDVGFTDAVVT